MDLTLAEKWGLVITNKIWSWLALDSYDPNPVYNTYSFASRRAIPSILFPQLACPAGSSPATGGLLRLKEISHPALPHCDCLWKLSNEWFDLVSPGSRTFTGSTKPSEKKWTQLGLKLRTSRYSMIQCQHFLLILAHISSFTKSMFYSRY